MKILLSVFVGVVGLLGSQAWAAGAPCSPEMSSCRYVESCTVTLKDPAGSIRRQHVIFEKDGLLMTWIHDGGMFKEYTADEVETMNVSPSDISDSEELLHLTKIIKVNFSQIASAQVFYIQPEDDGTLATIVLFKDKDGKLLGKSGIFGWLAGRCE